MLNYGWIIPAIPAVSFILILLFGKHFPKKGSEIGIAALSASFPSVDTRGPQICQGGTGHNSWYGDGQANALSAVTHKP